MSPLVGYGVSPWGSGSWGSIGYTAPGFNLGKAYAVGDRIVRVALSAEPMHLSVTGTGDALNPRTWSVQDPATGRVWTLLSVRPTDDSTYDLLTLETLPKHFTQLVVSSDTLLAQDRVPFPTVQFFFNGCYLAVNNTAESKLAANGVIQKDLTNAMLPAQNDALLSSSYRELTAGTLEIDSAGDYTTQFGADLVRKLILRRLIAKPGDFFHLPRYGLGLRVKEPLPASDLRKLAAAIEEQVNQEPEVQASKVNLSYSASAAALNVFIQVRLRPNGQVAQIPLVVPTGLVQL